MTGGFDASWFLYFSAILAVPVIIHLVYGLRRRRIPTGALWMIKRILEHNARRLRLRDILLLLLRMAAIALIVLAFARPIGWSGLEASGKVVVIIDDSYPMAEVEAGGDTLFARVVRKVKEHISGDAFQLVTLSGRGEGEFSDKSALSATLGRMRPGYAKGDLAGALNRAAGVEGVKRAVAAVGSWHDLGHGKPPVVPANLEHIEMVPLPSGCRLECTGVETLPAGKGVQLKLKITDERKLPHVVRLYRLGEGGRREEIVSRPITEGGPTVLRAENLPQQGTVLLTATVDGHDGLAVDDTVYVALELLQPVRVAVIVGRIVTPEFLSSGFYVKTALSVGSGFIVNEYAVKDLAIAAGRSDVLVFTDQALLPSNDDSKVKENGWLVFGYGGRLDDAALGASMGKGLGWEDGAPRAFENPIELDKDFSPFQVLDAEAFIGVEWGEGWRLSLAAGGWREALAIDGTPGIVYREAVDGAGRRLVIAAPPDRRHGGDLPVHKVFVPVVRAGAAWAAGRKDAQGINEKMRRVGEVWDLAESAQLRPENARLRPEGVLMVTDPGGDTAEVETIGGRPGVKLLEPGVYTALVRAGNARLRVESGAVEQLIIAANVAPITVQEPLSAETLAAVFRTSKEGDTAEEKPDPAAGPWRLLAIIALAILVVEALLSAAPIVRGAKRE